MNYTVDYPLAPFDAVMPAMAQNVLLTLVVIALAAYSVYALVLAKKYNSALPLFLLVGGFAACLMEPVITHLGHVIHPEIGQISLFKTNNRAIPLHIALIYPVYFCTAFFAMYSRIHKQSFDAGYVWKSYFITCVLAYLLEIIPVSIGLWVYYDNQGLWIWRGGMPLFWTFVNACCVLVSVTLVKICYPLLQGWKAALVIILVPAGGFMGHFGAGFFIYNVVNSGSPQWLVEVCALLSVFTALVIVALCARLLSNDTRAIAHAAASPAKV